MDNANQRRPSMSPILSSLLIFSLLRPLCAAEFNYASFESIRDAQNHGQVPVVGKVVPVQYRMVPGPAAEDPDEPPNLKKEQVVSLLDQMIVMLEKNPSLPEP